MDAGVTAGIAVTRISRWRRVGFVVAVPSRVQTECSR